MAPLHSCAPLALVSPARVPKVEPLMPQMQQSTQTATLTSTLTSYLPSAQNVI